MTDIWLVLRVFVSLAVVLLLAIVLLRLGAPLLEKLRMRRSSEIRLLEILPLDRHHKLALVRLRDKELLLGLAQGQLAPLAEWPSQDQEDDE